MDIFDIESEIIVFIILLCLSIIVPEIPQKKWIFLIILNLSFNFPQKKSKITDFGTLFFHFYGLPNGRTKSKLAEQLVSWSDKKENGRTLKKCKLSSEMFDQI